MTKRVAEDVFASVCQGENGKRGANDHARMSRGKIKEIERGWLDYIRILKESDDDAFVSVDGKEERWKGD